jgi:hypothetical protein
MRIRIGSVIFFVRVVFAAGIPEATPQ